MHHTDNDETSHRSVLATLRALIPQRTVRFHEALILADLQASRLLIACGSTEIPTADSVVGALPRISVEYRDLPTSGLSFWDGTNWVICLNQHEPPTRQRFTLLHEFKHVLDHGQTARLYRGDHLTAQRQAERAADYFAGCVLMPKKLVKRAWYDGLQDLGELAVLFNVSTSAMRVRISQLGLNGDTARCRRSTLRQHEGVLATHGESA